MTVSIGIPFYNPGRVFEAAVRSVFAQSHSDWELILIDDGSTDDSLARARAIEDPRVTVVSDGRNRGLCERLNQIARLAKHELVCRMDADDVMHPDRLTLQVDWLRRHPEVDVLGAQAITIDDAERATGVLGVPFDPANVLRTALARSLLVHVTVMARRRWFLEHPYDSEYVRAEDHEIWLRAAADSRYGFLQRPLVFVRQPDRLNVGAYVGSCRTDRLIFRRRGPAIVGPVGTAALLARSWSFEAVHRAASRLGATAWLMRLRGGRLDPATAADGLSALREASTFPVPGWKPARAVSGLA